MNSDRFPFTPTRETKTNLEQVEAPRSIHGPESFLGRPTTLYSLSNQQGKLSNLKQVEVCCGWTKSRLTSETLE